MQASAAPVEITALLGKGTSFSGKLFFTGNVRIDGRFTGEIHSDDVLVIGDGAEVEAEIHAGVVIVRGGTVRGNIRARASIELYVPAVVRGDLWAPSIFVDKGVRLEGSCRMGEEPGAAPPPIELASSDVNPVPAPDLPESDDSA